MRQPADNIIGSDAPGKVARGERLRAATVNQLIDAVGPRILRTGGLAPLLAGGDEAKGHFWLEVKDTSTVRVHGGTWVRHTPEGVRVVALTTTVGPSGLYADCAEVSVGADGYIIVTLTDTGGYSDALNPDTLTASYAAAYPTADSTDTVIVLGSVKTSGGAVVSVEQYWHGGDVEDFCMAPNPNCLDTVPITAADDYYGLQLRKWHDAGSETKDPTTDDGLLVFRYDGDGMLYYVDPADCGPVYDGASINDNSSTQWQIYGFETATSTPPSASDLFPYKGGGVINWCDLTDLADVISPELPEPEVSHHSLLAFDAESMSAGDGWCEFDDHGGAVNIDGHAYTAGLDLYRYMLLGTYTDRANTYLRNVPPATAADPASCIGDNLFVEGELHAGDGVARNFKADLGIESYHAGQFTDALTTATLCDGAVAGTFTDGSLSVKLGDNTAGAAVNVEVGDVMIAPSYGIYWGDPTAAGTWRLAIDGGELVVQMYDGAAWVEAGRFSAA